jgi:hypothetical protein
MTPRNYPSPEAFKQALEQRLRGLAGGAQLPRRRQLLIFDRLLARLTRLFGRAVTLKGGLVLELRLERARTTKDVDLGLIGDPDRLLERLQEAGRLDLGDHLVFELLPDPDHPQIHNEGLQYDGFRFRAEARLAGRLYGQPFGVDVCFGDPMLGDPEEVEADDLLAFAGVPPPKLRIYPIETHLAEKLHAFTQPRARPNSRVKNLPDLALLATIRPLHASRVRAALEQTFAHRRTHALPALLPDPPAAWSAPYAKVAREDGLPWGSLDEVAAAARAFLDPVLRDELGAEWRPDAWGWIPLAATAL